MANLHFFYGTAGMDIAAKLILDRFEFSKKYDDIWVIKPKSVQTTDKKIVSQTGLECPAEELSQIKWKDIIGRREFYYGAIMVYDAHLFTPVDIDSLVKLADTYDRKILCYGQMTDTNERLFPTSKHLIEVGAKLHELQCMCQMVGCRNRATHSLLFHKWGTAIPKPNESSVAEEYKRYKSVCRICYDRELNKKR